MSYLSLDLEFGGFDKRCSILTAYFATYDARFRKFDVLDLSLVPDDGLYIVKPSSMAVNKIDLIALAEKAVKYKDAKTLLSKFLEKSYNEFGEVKLEAVGSGVAGDIQRINSENGLLGEARWKTFVSATVQDTGTLARFLKKIGKLPPDLATGLQSLRAFFGIEIDGQPHSADYDSEVGIMVYQKLLEVGRSNIPLDLLGN